MPAAPLAENSWRLWAVPAAKAPDGRPPLSLHEAVVEALAESYFPGATYLDGPPKPSSVVVAARFDQSLLDFLEAGGRVLADLARFCNWNVAIPPGDATGMAYEEGKRRVFLRIKSLAEMDDRRLARLLEEEEPEESGGF